MLIYVNMLIYIYIYIYTYNWCIYDGKTRNIIMVNNEPFRHLKV